MTVGRLCARVSATRGRRRGAAALAPRPPPSPGENPGATGLPSRRPSAPELAVNCVSTCESPATSHDRKLFGIGLAVRSLIINDIGFRKQLPDFDIQIRADLTSAAVDNDSVEYWRNRMHRIEVGGKTRCRLRMAGGEDALRFQSAQQIRTARMADGARHVGEDVVGERVVRDGAVGRHIQRIIASWFQTLSAATPMRCGVTPI